MEETAVGVVRQEIRLTHLIVLRAEITGKLKSLEVLSL
jgi:hypothetical protein